MSNISSTSSSPTPLFNCFYNEQRGVRPRGMLGDVTSLRDRTAAVGRTFFTREETACIGYRLKRAQSNASGFFSKEQDEVQKKLDLLCDRITLGQLNPLRILYVAIMKRLLEARAFSRKFDGYIELERKRTPFREVIDQKLEEFFITFSGFQQYFKEGNEEIFVKFKTVIEVNLLAFFTCFRDVPVDEIGVSRRPVNYRSWLNPLIEHLTLLLDCLNNRKELFPLTLCPLSLQTKQRFILSSEIVDLLETMARAYVFGSELSEANFKKAIEKNLKSIKKCKVSQESKLLYATEIKKFEQIQKEIAALSQLLGKLAFSQDLARLKKLLNSKGRTANTNEKEVFLILGQVVCSLDEISERYSKVLSDFKSWDEGIRSRFAHLRRVMSEFDHLRSDLGTHFDLAIANSFFLVTIIKGFLDRYKKEFDVNAKSVEKLKAALPKDKSANSFFVNQGDLLFSCLLEKILTIYSDDLSPKSRQVVQDLALIVGLLKSKFLDLTSRPLAFSSDENEIKRKIKDICECFETTRQSEISFLEKKLKGEGLDSLKAVDSLFGQIQEALVNDAKDWDCFRFFPLYGFLTESLHPSSAFNEGLLRFFNAQLSISRRVARQADFKSIGIMYNKDSLDDLPEAIKEALEASSSGMKLLLEVQETLKNYPELKSEEDAMKLAQKLMAFQESFFNMDRLHDKESLNWMKQICEAFSGPRPLEFMVNTEVLESSEENGLKIIDRLTEINVAFDSYFLLHHLPLLRWAKETLLFPSTPKKEKEIAKITPSFELYLEEPDEEESAEASTSAAAPVQMLPPKDYLAFQMGIIQQIHYLKRMKHPAISREGGELALIRQEQLSSGIELIKRTYLPILKNHDFLRSYFSAETALIYSALSLEQALKHRLALLFPSHYGELRASHDLAELLDAAQIREDFSEKELNAVRSAADVVQKSSRYLWGTRGASAHLLRQFASREATYKQVAEVKEITQHLLSGVEKVFESITQKKGEVAQVSQETSSSNEASLSRQEKDYLEQIESRLENMEALLEKLAISHLGSPLKRVCVGNTSEESRQFRERQIIKSLRDSNYYLHGIREVLPSFFNEKASYARTNFIFMKLSLLLEQNLHALIAYLDVPSEKNPSIHALFEEVGTGKSARPRSHDHNIKEAFLILEAFLGEKELQLAESEKEHIFSLSNFLGRTHRYLSAEEKGEVSELMYELKLLSHVSEGVESGFLTKEERTELKKRLGDNEAKWLSKHAEQLKILKEEKLCPKILETLKGAEKLLQFFLQLNNGHA